MDAIRSWSDSTWLRMCVKAASVGDLLGGGWVDTVGGLAVRSNRTRLLGKAMGSLVIIFLSLCVGYLSLDLSNDLSNGTIYCKG